MPIAKGLRLYMIRFNHCRSQWSSLRINQAPISRRNQLIGWRFPPRRIIYYRIQNALYGQRGNLSTSYGPIRSLHARRNALRQ